MQWLEEHAVPHSQAHKPARMRQSTSGEKRGLAAMIAIRGSKIVYANMDEVKQHSDMKLRRGKDEWWSDIKRLAELMGGRTGVVASTTAFQGQ